MEDINKRKEQFSTYFHYAMQYGLYMGFFFSFIFLCFIAIFQLKIMALQSLVFISFIAIPFLVYFLVKKVRDNVLNKEITFSMAWNLGTLIFFFGGLILAVVIYVFLQFITPNLFHEIVSFIQETVAALSQNAENLVPQEQIDLLQKLSKEIENAPVPSAIDVAVQNLWYCVSFGIFISIPIALIVKKKNPNTNIQKS